MKIQLKLWFNLINVHNFLFEFSVICSSSFKMHCCTVSVMKLIIINVTMLLSICWWHIKTCHEFWCQTAVVTWRCHWRSAMLSRISEQSQSKICMMTPHSVLQNFTFFVSNSAVFALELVSSLLWRMRMNLVIKVFGVYHTLLWY